MIEDIKEVIQTKPPDGKLPVPTGIDDPYAEIRLTLQYGITSGQLITKLNDANLPKREGVTQENSER